MKILHLNPNEYKGGVGIWASFKPVFTNRDRRNVTEPITGVHVHARKKIGLVKSIDYTFDKVFLNLENYGMNIVEITKNAILSYFLAENLGLNIISIECPYCGVPHLDEGKFAVKPHKHHLCMSCGKDFFHDEKAISNPLLKIRLAILEQNPEPELIKVTRPLVISKDEYSGGIELYGTHKALIWTSKVSQESGVHIHCYDKGGLSRIVDDTYGQVFLEGNIINSNDVQILQAQLISEYLCDKVKTVYCAKCGQVQNDEGIKIYTPHQDFLCTSCGYKFETDYPIISNRMYDILVKNF